MTIERHTLAMCSIIGCSLDVLGSLYLAYDLLGGEHGPLRTLTRGVTYGLLFGTGYALAFGPVFGVATGVAHGITLGWEYARASRGVPKSGRWADAAMSAIRGVGFGAGAAYLYGVRFGITFGALSTLGQIVAYHLGFTPTTEYQPAIRLRVTRLQMLGTLNRTIGYIVAGCVSGLVAQEPGAVLSIGVKFGLVIGVVTALMGAFNSLIEWGVDRVPEKGMGVFGVGLILVGFTLQSVQYWVALLDVGVR